MEATISVDQNSQSSLVLPAEDTVYAAVDFNGHPAIRSMHGLWKSAFFVIALELTERFAFFGVSSNLINYVTGQLGQSTAMAAASFNAWIGVTYLLPIFGGVIADCFLGRYRMILAASLCYILGIGLITLSSLLPWICCFNCEGTSEKRSGCSPHLQIVTFYVALYMVAFGLGGQRPSLEAFAADQFDGEHPEEAKARSFFFNWWFFGLSIGCLSGNSVTSYVQDNLSWPLGFTIPLTAMVLGFVVFLLGSTTYRYMITNGEMKSPFVRIGRVFMLAASNCSTNLAHCAKAAIQPHSASEQFKFLNKALLSPESSESDRNEVCSIGEVEEAKSLLRLFPIWATSLVYGIVAAQQQTLFTKQCVTLDRSIGSSFTIPAASLQAVGYLVCLLFIPIYEFCFVPVARALTGKAAGISTLQRMGAGYFLSTLSMITAAIVEKRRLKTAFEHGLIDFPNVTIPMKFWWLVPQYALYGISESLAMVGQQEFFYDQIPTGLRSVGLSIYLSIYGLGSLFSSFLISVVDKVTREAEGESWFTDNVNRAHFDYFYWLVAAMNAAGLGIFICSANWHTYRKNNVCL